MVEKHWFNNSKKTKIIIYPPFLLYPIQGNNDS
jgi:hypothetical protein